MISKYFSLALRKLLKNRAFSFINVAGLSAGMAAFIFIGQYIAFERSYNSFHVDASDIYRVVGTSENSEWSAYSAPGFAPLAAGAIPGIEQYCRIAEGANLGTGVVRYVDENKSVDKSFRENDFAYVDGNFFGFFTFKIISGSAASLNNPNTVALSRSAAMRYFGNLSVSGNILTLSNQFGQTEYAVAAVYENMPDYSDLHYELLFSLRTLENKDNLAGNEGWASIDGTGSQWLFTYLKLKAGIASEPVAQEYADLIKSKDPDFKGTAALQPIKTMHLGSSLSETLPTFGSLRFIYLLSIIAAMILAVAWFNYVNLSTAGALRRAKEVGISKVLGASKGQLIKQFLSESALLNVFALIIAIAIVGILQGPYDELIGRRNSAAILASQNFWILTAGIILTGTFIFGIYTAVLLSSFDPSHVLKAGFSGQNQGGGLRKALVVVQFVVSAVLFISTLVVYQQLRYMQNIDLGMNIANLVVVRGADVKDENYSDRKAEFEDKISSAAFVQQFSKSGNVPMDGFNFSTSGITRLSPLPGDERTSYNILSIDEKYLDTYRIPLAAGLNFTAEECDKGMKGFARVIVNETAARALGFENSTSAIGQKILWGERELEIKGVIKDYHHLSAQFKIEPIVMQPSRNSSYYTLKLANGSVSEQLSSIAKFYQESFPGNPFEFDFVDEKLKAKYNTEQQYSTIFTLSAMLAIFIGCLGLFGLSKHNVDRRIKEIGIRKVLGSSVVQIIHLVSRDFMWLIAAAFVIGIPVSLWIVNRWLEGFAYRVDVSWWIFGASAVVIIVIAWITVAVQAYRGAVSNPVEALKNE